jgi:putative cell wall-binding protein/5-hydroxyisourate hydrolase-like protein (transthyretin family)
MNVRGRVLRSACIAAAIAFALGVTPAFAIYPALAPQPASLEGLVTDAVTKAPIAGAEVLLEPGQPADIAVACLQSTSTDAAGHYQFSGMATGWYYLRVQAAGYEATDTPSFPYSGTGTMQYGVALNPLKTVLTGRLLSGGQPVPGYKVKIWRVDGGTANWLGYNYTPADGSFTFYNDTMDVAGIYRFTVYNSNYELVMTSDDFRYDGVTPIKMDLALEAGAERLADSSRFSTSVTIAREKFDPGAAGAWPGVKDVVIASGDDVAAADPLSAAGMCGAYHAPLFLLSRNYAPTELITALVQITKANGPVVVHVVGGPSSVPDARLAEIQAAVGKALVTFDRVAGSDRFDTAAKVALDVAEKLGRPQVVLIANGADATKFFDALALSPVAAAQGYPILLVGAGKVPASTQAALAALAPQRVIIGGGTATVSDSVKNQLHAERWAGPSRYDTAVIIADRAIASGWVSCNTVGVAAKLADALTGGSFCGQSGGVLVLTDGARLSTSTRNWLDANDARIGTCYVFGGTRSLTPTVRGDITYALSVQLAK